MPCSLTIGHLLPYHEEIMKWPHGQSDSITRHLVAQDIVFTALALPPPRRPPPPLKASGTHNEVCDAHPHKMSSLFWALRQHQRILNEQHSKAALVIRLLSIPPVY